MGDGVFYKMLHFKCLIINNVTVCFGMLRSVLHFKSLIFNNVTVVTRFLAVFGGIEFGGRVSSEANVAV